MDWAAVVGDEAGANHPGTEDRSGVLRKGLASSSADMQDLCCDGLTRAQHSGCDSVAPQRRGRSTHDLLEARGWSRLGPQTWDLAGPCLSQGLWPGAPAREA